MKTVKNHSLLMSFWFQAAAVLVLLCQQIKPVNASWFNYTQDCPLPFSDHEFYIVGNPADSRYFALSIDEQYVNTTYIASARLLLNAITDTCQQVLQLDTNPDHSNSFCWSSIGSYHFGWFKIAGASETLLARMQNSTLGHDASAHEPWGCINGVLNQGLLQPAWYQEIIWQLTMGGAGLAAVICAFSFICVKKTPQSAEKTPLLINALEPKDLEVGKHQPFAVTVQIEQNSLMI